jgi:Uma2 family endonuclease
MLTLPAPPVSVAELTQLGTDDGRVELVDGTYMLRPWPTPLQDRATRRLAKLLADAATPDAKVFPRRTAVEVGPRSLVIPDIVVAPNRPDERRPADLPLLVVEVADASKRRFDRLKLDVYRERGVPLCWLVDPDLPGIDAYELVDGDYVLSATARGESALAARQPFPVTVVPAGLVDPPDPD